MLAARMRGNRAVKRNRAKTRLTGRRNVRPVETSAANRFSYGLFLFAAVALLASCAGRAREAAAPTSTPTAAETQSATFTPTLFIRDPVIVPVLCTLKGRPVERAYPRQTPIVLSWGWEAKTKEQIADFLEAHRTRITFDGEVISEYVW